MVEYRSLCVEFWPKLYFITPVSAYWNEKLMMKIIIKLLGLHFSTVTTLDSAQYSIILQ